MLLKATSLHSNPLFSRFLEYIIPSKSQEAKFFERCNILYIKAEVTNV